MALRRAVVCKQTLCVNYSARNQKVNGAQKRLRALERGGVAERGLARSVAQLGSVRSAGDAPACILGLGSSCATQLRGVERSRVAQLAQSRLSGLRTRQRHRTVTFTRYQ